MPPIDITSDEQFDSLVSKVNTSLVALNFWADWAEPCKHLNEVFAELAVRHPKITFIKIEAENFPDISETYEVASVPTFILLQGANIVTRIEGANASLLSSSVAAFSNFKETVVKSTLITPAPPASTEDLEFRLKSLINNYPVMLFMKGNPEDPRCGFSRETVEIFNQNNVDYKTFDILEDERVRQGLKDFSKWPTYPQIYIKGEFIGGLDILKEVVASGEFQKMLPTPETLNDRLKKLINKAPIM
ncbi:Glutaredoxin 3, partial [Nowakowskiella sp. JEL0078]